MLLPLFFGENKMPLVNMKRAEVEQKGETLLGEPVDASKEDYYYGLTINLEEPELQKLNLGDDPKVGGMIKLQAVGKLVMYSKDDKRGRRAEIQIQSLGIADKPQENRSEVLYPEKGNS